MCQRARLRAIAAATPRGRLWVNLRHDRTVRTSPLVPRLPPRHTRFLAAVTRHNRS